MVKHLPTMRETWVWFLGWEDPLEKEMATHSSTLAWKIPWTEAAPSMDSQRVRHDWETSLHFTSLHELGRGTPQLWESAGTFILGFWASIPMKNKCIWFKSSSPWYSVTATQKDQAWTLVNFQLWVDIKWRDKKSLLTC